MKAVVLGAGYGTKLYPITKNRPKPLLPVGDEPILDHILDRLKPISSLDDVFVVTNDRFYSHYRGWKEAREGTDRVHLINDGSRTPEDRLGAIGDVQFAIEQREIRDDLLVVAGDNVLEFDLTEFVSFFEEHGSVIGLKQLDEQEVGSYSVVDVDENHRIVDFEEKPAVPRTSLISIGLYLFKADHIGLIEQYLDADHNPDEPGYLIEWMHRQVPIYGYRVEGAWYDIGDIRSYNQANEHFEARS